MSRTIFSGRLRLPHSLPPGDSVIVTEKPLPKQLQGAPIELFRLLILQLQLSGCLCLRPCLCHPQRQNDLIVDWKIRHSQVEGLQFLLMDHPPQRVAAEVGLIRWRLMPPCTLILPHLLPDLISACPLPVVVPKNILREPIDPGGEQSSSPLKPVQPCQAFLHRIGCDVLQLPLSHRPHSTAVRAGRNSGANIPLPARPTPPGHARLLAGQPGPGRPAGPAPNSYAALLPMSLTHSSPSPATEPSGDTRADPDSPATPRAAPAPSWLFAAGGKGGTPL